MGFVPYKELMQHTFMTAILLSTDVEKALDRACWQFIEAVLLKIQYPNSFVICYGLNVS